MTTYSTPAETLEGMADGELATLVRLADAHIAYVLCKREGGICFEAYEAQRQAFEAVLALRAQKAGQV